MRPGEERFSLPQRLFVEFAFPPTPRDRWRRYGFTALSVAVTVALTAFIQRLTGGAVLLIPLIGVIFATWYGGITAGIIAVVLSALATLYLVVPPFYSLRVSDSGDAVRLIVLVPLALLVAAITDIAGQAGQRLRRAGDELRRANLAKDEFLGLVSHELRTPITTIYGNARILQRRLREADDASCLALQDIEDEVIRLRQVIENMLLLSRLEAGDLQPEPVLIQHLVGRVTGQQGQHEPVRVAVRAEGDLPPVLGQPVYIEQVVRNLLSNAAKYSPDHEPVEVRIVRQGENVSVSVLDRGPGIDEDERDAIFGAFYRSRRTSPASPGAGIGLAVCKRLVEAQSGRIWVRNREGGGSEFGFTLPICDEAAE